jgi:hypothetical protein
MNIFDYFTYRDKVSFLERKHYTIKKVEVEMEWSVYHNDVESAVIIVDGVFKDDKPFMKPCMSDFDEYQWVDDAFIKVMKEALLSL